MFQFFIGKAVSAAQEATGSAPAITLTVAASFLVGPQDASGTPPVVTPTVATSTLSAGNSDVGGAAPSITLSVAVSGTIGGEPAEITTSVSPACGGLYRLPQTNEIRVADPNAPPTVQQLNTVLKQLREISQRLGNMPLIQQLDFTSRVALMLTAGTVVAEYDDVISVQIAGLSEPVTVAKPPGMQGSTGGHTIGSTVYIQMVNGGTTTGGAPLPGNGVGTGIPGVAYIDATPSGGAEAGFTGDKEVVVDVQCVADELVITKETWSFVNGRLITDNEE